MARYGPLMAVSSGMQQVPFVVIQAVRQHHGPCVLIEVVNRKEPQHW